MIIENFDKLNEIYSEKIGLEIRYENELLDNEKLLIEKSKLGTLAPVEAWTSLGTNQQLAYATHGIFRYFGKFPPPIATYLINKYTQEGDLVIDPMCGSGTTAVEAAFLNRRCVVNDLNPLSILLAKVKSTRIEESLLREKLEYIKNVYKPLTNDEYSFLPISLRDPKHWFLPKTIDSLRGLKYIIENEENKDIKDFLNIIFASTVRRVSKATTQQGRLFLDVDTAIEDVLPIFVKKYEIGVKGVSKIPFEVNIRYFNCDVKVSFDSLSKEKADLIILHPPYFNSYKYSSVNCLETGWLGIDRFEYSKMEIREFFKVGKVENVTKYIDDMAVVLNNAITMLKKNGTLALMIGDTIIKNEYVPVTKMLLDKIYNTGSTIEKIAIRVPKYTEAAWVASQRRKSANVGVTLYDFIIVIRRLE